MIRPQDSEAAEGGGFGVLSLMRALDKQLVSETGPSSEASQHLFYEAMEATSDEEQDELLREALKLDPGNIDALLNVLKTIPMTIEDEIELLEKIVILAEKRLGKTLFHNLSGHFWGAIETRPYMRAKHQLADALYETGRLADAVTAWETMLRLNPNDNQGTRYLLLPCLLSFEQMKKAEKLFQAFDECHLNTCFAWCKVLERFLQNDLEGAASALATARKQNPYSEPFLRGSKRLPSDWPPDYTPGTKEEALCFAELLLTAWEAHPAAIEWLCKQPKPKTK